MSSVDLGRGPGGRADVRGPDGELWDEATLVARARDRDVAAFEALVRRHQRGIYGLCRRMIGRDADAQDVVQEVFLAAWRRLPDLQDDAAFAGWLYRAATNQCLSALRRRKPTAPIEDDAPPPDGGATAPGADPARQAQNSAAMAALGEALQRLTPRQRACWLLYEVHGRSYDEIARMLDTTNATVRGRIARARAELAEVMRPWR